MIVRISDHQQPKMGFKQSSDFIVLVLMVSCICQRSEAFGLNIHHRLSDPVKAMFNNNDQFPMKGSIDYYAAMVHRDRVLQRRRLAGEKATDTLLHFAAGNSTVQISGLGFLYYANVTVGTPESWYLVALDTGSHLFWLPCDCVPNCLTRLGDEGPDSGIDLNMYSLRSSSTGTQLTCDSPFCQDSRSCDPTQVNCPYRVAYLQANTSSSGYLVEDVVHLATNSNNSALNARIPFGCGVLQTGSFLTSAAPNGLLGLTKNPISLPSILASQNLTTDSYSMCFTKDGTGNIIFGDRDGNTKGETPLDPNDMLDLYNVSVTHIGMGTDVSATNFSVIIDTGTSFTHLTDPAYTLLSGKFDSQVNDPRVEVHQDNIFRYCYVSNLSPDDLIVPAINLTMGGGSVFTVTDPVFVVEVESGQSVYCLAVSQSGPDEHNINIIGENFLTGYRIVFDHERMVLGWKEHDCGEVLPLSPRLPSYNPSITEAGVPQSGSTSALQRSYLFICILLIQILRIQQKFF